MKKVSVTLGADAEKVYKHLVESSKESKFEMAILKSIKKKSELIKLNYHYGEPISKNKIPKKFKEEFNITNLFWVELANHWRLLYTLIDGESDVEIVAFVLNISDHKKYNKIMQYKGK
jgi:hypothetical protein